MAVAEIRERLALNLRSIQSVKRVYKYKPSDDPQDADCPCMIIERGDPFDEISPFTNSTLRHVYHFKILILLYPIGKGTAEQWEKELDEFYDRVGSKIFGDITLNGNMTTVGSKVPLHVGQVTFGAMDYFGAAMDYDAEDHIAQAFA